MTLPQNTRPDTSESEIRVRVLRKQARSELQWAKHYLHAPHLFLLFFFLSYYSLLLCHNKAAASVLKKKKAAASLIKTKKKRLQQYKLTLVYVYM